MCICKEPIKPSLDPVTAHLFIGTSVPPSWSMVLFSPHNVNHTKHPFSITPSMPFFKLKSHLMPSNTVPIPLNHIIVPPRTHSALGTFWAIQCQSCVLIMVALGAYTEWKPHTLPASIIVIQQHQAMGSSPLSKTWGTGQEENVQISPSFPSSWEVAP
jgi:hypothetical protein